MAVGPVFEKALPATPPWTSFVDGELALSVRDDVGTAPQLTTFYLARILQLPPGLYRIKMYADDAAVMRVGTERTSMRDVFRAASAGLVSGDFIVYEGESRIEFILTNLGSAPNACFIAFSIFRDTRLIYASAEEFWLQDTVPIADADLLGYQDDRYNLPVFTMLPNWQNGVLERLQWKTDVMRSESAHEQRRDLRMYPARSFEVSFLRKGTQRVMLDNFFTGQGSKKFLLPLWHEQYRVPVPIAADLTGFLLPDHADREFHNGELALIMRTDPNNFDVVTIDSVNHLGNGRVIFLTAPTQSWPAGTRVMPLKVARILDFPSFSNLTDGVGQVSVRFDLAETDAHVIVPIREPGTSTPFFPIRPDWSTPIALDYQRESFIMDNDLAGAFVVDPSDQAMVGARTTAKLFGRAKVFEFRRFLSSVAGRAITFYQRTYTNDLVPTGDTIVGDSIECKPTDFFETMHVNQRSRAGILIAMYDGTIYYGRIVTVEPVGLSTRPTKVDAEVYYLDTTLPEIAMADVKRIEFLNTARFDQDQFELKHHVDDSAAVTVSLVTRVVEEVI